MERRHPPPDWLEEFNEKLRVDGVPAARRPWLALQAWSETSNASVTYPSAEANYVFTWFQHRTGGASATGRPFYRAAHYFDVAFWPLEIPLVYGAPEFNAAQGLHMPPRLLSDIASSPDEMQLLRQALEDWFDYSYGLDDLRKGELPPGLEADLLASAERDLGSATLDLLGNPPNSHAALLARNATEKHTKFLLVRAGKLTEGDLRKIGHDLDVALNRVRSVAPAVFEPSWRSRFAFFPSYVDGYGRLELDRPLMWECYRLAREVAVAVIRWFTERDSRGAFR